MKYKQTDAPLEDDAALNIVHIVSFLKTTHFVVFIIVFCSNSNMLPLKGTALLAVVSTICSLGFSLVGFDNGLMGGFGQFKSLLLSH